MSDLHKNRIKKTKKQSETERFVDSYIESFNFPPTYKDIQEKFGISTCAAHARCRHFRHKMRTNLIKPTKKHIKHTYVYFVPIDKTDKFNDLQSEIKKALADE